MRCIKILISRWKLSLFVICFSLALVLSSALVGWVYGGPAAETGEFTVFPLNPAFEEYIESDEPEDGTSLFREDSRKTGFIPPPIEPAVDEGPAAFHFFTLPSSFDLRDTGRITGVRDQSPYGSCWAFGAYGSLESFLKPETTYNFSENNMMHLHGFDTGPSGGNQFMAMAYLARWNGPVLEEDDPYGSTPTEGLDAVEYVQQVDFIARDATTVKQALMDDGAIFTAMRWDDNFFNNSTSAYYFNGFESLNHAVTLAGWDDNYSRNNFKHTPPGDGAWIMKNSWGTWWGENGYFYLSYYDTHALAYLTAFHNSEDTNSFDHVYEYDYLGWISNTGIQGYSSIYGANIFTALAGESLRAVSTYMFFPHSGYEIKVYTGVDGNNPVSGDLKLTQSGTITRAGYHTIELNNAVSLQAGEKFSVVVKYSAPGGNDAHMPIERVLNNFSSNATASPGESFLSRDGADWIDATEVNNSWNVCIKAFSVLGEPSCSLDAPDRPEGPEDGEVDTGYSYRTGGSSCEAGHDVEFRFDWGDGNRSCWSLNTERIKSWDTEGVYEVRAQARCKENPEVESEWSDLLAISITEEDKEESGDGEDESGNGDNEEGEDDSGDKDNGDGGSEDGDEEDPGDEDSGEDGSENGDEEEPGDDNGEDEEESSEEEVKEYNLTVEAKPADGGEVTGAGSYEEGTEATVTASANEGFEFVRWTEDGAVVSTDNEYNFTISSDSSLKANFEEKETDPVEPSPSPEPAEPDPPSKTVAVSPSNNVVVEGDTVDFSWEKAERADSYQLQVRVALDNSIFKEPEPGNTTSVRLEGFPDDGTEFKWRVRAENTGGYGAWSDYNSFQSGNKPVIVYGDVTGNGLVDVNDVVRVMRFVLDLEALGDDQFGRSDVNGDGKVDIHDVTMIMQKALGLIDEFPVDRGQ